MERNARPRWWRLYVIAVLLVGVVGLVETSVQGEVVRKVLDSVDVVAGFGLIGVWVRRNRGAFDLAQDRRRV
jgi:hypothetical protein